MEKIKHELDLLPMVLRTKTRKTTGKAPLIIRITLKDQKPKELPVGPGTYYMKMKYLQEKNYIDYYPSHTIKVPSMVSMKREVNSEQRRQIHNLSGSTRI